MAKIAPKEDEYSWTDVTGMTGKPIYDYRGKRWIICAGYRINELLSPVRKEVGIHNYTKGNIEWMAFEEGRFGSGCNL